jgi:hypothetical protein
MFVYEVTEENADEAAERDAEQALAIFDSKRSAFVHRYGILQPDGTRVKRYIE